MYPYPDEEGGKGHFLVKYPSCPASFLLERRPAVPEKECPVAALVHSVKQAPQKKCSARRPPYLYLKMRRVALGRMFILQYGTGGVHFPLHGRPVTVQKFP